MTLLHALRSDAIRCVCGSGEVFRRPGFFGTLGMGVGFTRYACRTCRRRFWLRSSLQHRGITARHPGPTHGLPGPPAVDASALDLERIPTAKSLAPDLRELDDQLDRVRKRPAPNRGGRRG